MKPYSEYKPTGLAWLPEIPRHWKSAKLRNLLSIVSKKNHPEQPLLSVVREKGVIRRDVDSKEENHNYIPEDLSNYKVVRKGQFAMNKMKAWQGSYGISQYDGIVSPAYFVFDLHGVSADFFNIAIRSKAYIPYFAQASDGIRVGQWDLSLPRMHEIPFFIPPADEQAQIVRYLDAMTAKINKLIRAKKRQIALLQEQKQAIINQAVTRGLDPDVELKDSGIDWLGPIPKQWEIKTVKQYFKIRKQIAGHEGYDVLSITQDGIKIKDISTNEGQMAMSYAGYQLVRPGDFAMNHMDLLTGYVDRSNYFGVTSPDYRVFELCDNVNCHPDFFLYVFQLYYKRRIFYRYGRGAASVGRWRLPAREFLNFVIPVPPIISQKRIVRFVKNNTQNIDKNILAVESQIKILSEYKNSLIAAVVTGKIDVRNIAVEAVSPEDLAPSDDPDESEEQDSLRPEESEE